MVPKARKKSRMGSNTIRLPSRRGCAIGESGARRVVAGLDPGRAARRRACDSATGSAAVPVPSPTLAIAPSARPRASASSGCSTMRGAAVERMRVERRRATQHRVGAVDRAWWRCARGRRRRWRPASAQSRAPAPATRRDAGAQAGEVGEVEARQRQASRRARAARASPGAPRPAACRRRRWSARCRRGWSAWPRSPAAGRSAGSASATARSVSAERRRRRRRRGVPRQRVQRLRVVGEVVLGSMPYRT